MNKPELRLVVKDNLAEIIKRLNKVLAGNTLVDLVPVLTRLGKGGKLPHWYEQLLKSNTFPNLDGKSIGSIVEMLFVGILETQFLNKYGINSISVNPARGVDIPDLDLGIKSPSENFCTSEPFFSAYERLLGNEHDAIILLTDYQTAKKTPPLRVSIIDYSYLHGSEIADRNLCTLARKHRDWLLSEDETWAKKIFRFIAFVNQSDWLAKQLVILLDRLDKPKEILALIEKSEEDFKRQNKKRRDEDREEIPEEDFKQIQRIAKIQPLHLGVVTAIDDWVADTQKDFGRLPNDNEWSRLKTSPLNGRIGMSFALQWRYNFGSLFRQEGDEMIVSEKTGKYETRS